jgi:hypothetical protein
MELKVTGLSSCLPLPHYSRRVASGILDIFASFSSFEAFAQTSSLFLFVLVAASRGRELLLRYALASCPIRIRLSHSTSFSVRRPAALYRFSSTCLAVP